MRAELGLTPLRFDPVVRRVVLRMARNDLADRSPEVIDAQPDCAVCDMFYERGAAVDPRALYRSLGGTRCDPLRPLAGRVERVRQSLGLLSRGRSSARPACTDARLRSQTPLGMLVVGVTADIAARFDTPVRWPSGPMDPRRQLWVEVVLASWLRLSESLRRSRRAGRERGVSACDRERASAGRGSSPSASTRRSRTAARTTSARYRLGVRLKTRGMPPAFGRRSWTFRLGERGRASSVPRRRAPDAGAAAGAARRARRRRGRRRWVGGLPQRRRLRGGPRGPGDDRHGRLGEPRGDPPRARSRGLRSRARRARPPCVRSAFIRTGWEKVQFIPVSEQFADQVEHWALGKESGDPALAVAERVLAAASRTRRVPAAVGPRPASALEDVGGGHVSITTPFFCHAIDRDIEDRPPATPGLGDSDFPHTCGLRSVRWYAGP